MVNIASTLVLIRLLPPLRLGLPLWFLHHRRPISIALLSDLESRQSITATLSLQPSPVTAPAMPSLTKPKPTLQATAPATTFVNPSPSPCGRQGSDDGFNNAAANNCGSKCTTSGMSFAPDVAASCPAGYVYSFEGMGVAAGDLSRTGLRYYQDGSLHQDRDGKYLLGNHGRLFKSVNTDQTTDAGKYKAAVKKIDAAEVNKVCGEGFLKGQTTSGAFPSIAFRLSLPLVPLPPLLSCSK
ncbi:hypothetical protein BC829DRAFT_487411 [Chytridium lagenaria]|nr:hypothetical protein BC829DRAFT_487411 [Chytridium lagenaria]